MNGEPTHEIYAYIDVTGEPVTMTDPEPCKMRGDELYDAMGQCVGVCGDFYEEVPCQRTCHDCKGEGKINHAKNRHYEDWKTCAVCKGEGTVAGTTTAEKPGGKRWTMPNHNTTLLLRKLKTDA